MNSWTSTLRFLGTLPLVLGAASAALAATDLGNGSKDTAACCQLTTSLIQDVLRGKDSSGDERFFSSEGAPPNIHFLIDTSGSMRELPQISNSNHIEFFTNTTNGCVNARLDAFAAANAWDPNFQYPIPDPGTGLGSDNGFPNLFQDSKFYGYMYWNDLSDPPSQWNSKEEACQSQVPDWAGTRAADYAQCQSCLSTKGYYKLPEAEAVNTGDLTNPNFILWGRFLNFNPPKYVTARAVLKQVIKDLRRVRAGYSYFSNTGVNTELGRGQNPSCDQILNDSSAFDNNRGSYINGINGLSFSTGTPLARSLLNVGYYFTSSDDVYQNQFGFGAGYTYPNAFKNGALTSQGRSVCWGCQVSSVIIITDGEPSSDSLNPTIVTKLRAMQGNTYCPDTLPCGPGPTSQRDKGNNPTNVGDDNLNYMLDDVARLLANNDLQYRSPPVVGDFNTAGKQTVSTYTVGFGINSNLLLNTAKVGNGLYYTADNGPALKQALLDIISNVVTRATSFSSAAASSLNVRSASSTLIPRFKPARSKTSPWQGYLYRFNLGPEKLLNCVANGAGDLNNDGDCDDTHLIDKNGKAVIENDDGDFVQLLSPNSLATPFWEAGAKLRPGTAATQKWMTRRIYTIVDSNGDKKLDSRDTPIEFSEANLATLRDYLGISDNPTACNDLAAQIGQASMTPDECARTVIRWYRGADSLNPDPAQRDYDRPFLLHDIFHSSPISVEPPTPKTFCDFSNQCTYTLFSGSTPREPDTTPRPGSDAYDRYVYESGGRDKIVLVGANGGMVHAFHNGKKTGVDPITTMSEYDEGTGDELWAFVPPDMLAKLRPNVGKHAYFVDGTPMVREVWLDGTGGAAADGTKQWQEYRTVAVVGSGRGGVHRFALDLTRLLGNNMDSAANVVVPNSAGDFLWMWPQPCDPLALQVGESFSNFAPRPPPIGPVALTENADNALRSLIGGGAANGAPWKVNGIDARERWVVALNGGYDQNMSRGRGMAIVDMRTGHTLWSFFHGDGQNRSDNLKYPIGAGLSLLDIGKGEAARDVDLLMDSATVGDYGGNLWMLRMWNPGEWNASTGRIDNWFAARAFRVANPPTSGSTENVRGPLSYMTTNTIQPEDGRLRTFIGTGDKENILDRGSVCRLSNKLSCAAQGCESNTQVTVTRGATQVWRSNANYAGYHYNGGANVPGATNTNSCGGTQVTLNWVNNPGGSCTNDNDGSIQYTCDGNSTTWSCRETANSWVSIKSEVATKPYPRRFYGVWTYGKSADGVSADRTFNTDAQATAYDAARFTDTDLVDVTNFGATGVVSNAAVEAPATGKGWFLEYAQNDERTGGTGALVNGCMIWGSFEPSGSAGVVCSTTGTNKSRLYQSNFATGRANCAAGFYTKTTNTWARYVEFTTVATTPEPVPQLTLAGGQLSRSVTIVGAGTSTPGGGGGNGPFSIDVRATNDAVKSLYQIELDRRAHDCRHEGIATACD